MSNEITNPETQSLTSFELHPTAPELSKEQSNLLTAQWQTFLEARNQSHIPNFEISKGDLVHNMSDPDNLVSILRTGIVSGEIGFEGKNPIPEDMETHLCADFFVIPDSVVSVRGYLGYTQERIQEGEGGKIKRSRPENYLVPLERTNNVMLIFEGNSESEKYQALLRNSATSQDLEITSLRDFPIKFPLQTENHRAVLVGLPSNHIKGVVFGGRVANEQIVNVSNMRDELGLRFKIYNHLGEEITTQ